MFSLSIDTGNAAFETDPHRELARILRLVAEELETTHTADIGERIALRDQNGNTVGHAIYHPSTRSR